jgi:hypothetical protein
MAKRVKRTGKLPKGSLPPFPGAVTSAAILLSSAAAVDISYSLIASQVTGDPFGKHELVTDVMRRNFPSVLEQIWLHAVTIVGADGQEQTVYPTPAPEIPTLQVPDEKTPTPVAPTPTPGATSTPTHTETPTPEPTPTPTSINEKDLQPAYTETINEKFMGVVINAQLITDESLDPLIRKVTVSESVYAEFIARTIFKTWWLKGEVRHTGAPTKEDFKNFMALWAKAQETNDPNDWKQVQLNNIWANDLNDGTGYKQQPYTIWPMYSGTQVPEGVRGINNFAILLVKASRMKNIDMFRNNAYQEGMGTNILNENLYVYNGFVNSNNGNEGVASSVAYTAIWLIKNSGSGASGYGSIDTDLTKLLLRGSLMFQ